MYLYTTSAICTVTPQQSATVYFTFSLLRLLLAPFLFSPSPSLLYRFVTSTAVMHNITALRHPLKGFLLPEIVSLGTILCKCIKPPT
jgi:hypothetical protein